MLPPFVLYGTDRMTGEDHPDVAEAWEQRLLTLEPTEPIAFRRQNSGDHEMPSLHLRDGLEPSGRTGFGLHVRGWPPAADGTSGLPRGLLGGVGGACQAPTFRNVTGVCRSALTCCAGLTEKETRQVGRNEIPRRGFFLPSIHRIRPGIPGRYITPQDK
ncbi:hypothetical protein GCM10010347_25820 [Streptomyces cirratus]|uniref:Uncharacterized protein n=1 Tax=Streptomyces cirratus TaxID=68187 RepID=A0ABQ3ETH2_9ACTN|nr:hypothetical protein GCM10010347_25820 [Streptomyces cirratus]